MSVVVNVDVIDGPAGPVSIIAQLIAVDMVAAEVDRSNELRLNILRVLCEQGLRLGEIAGRILNRGADCVINVHWFVFGVFGPRSYGRHSEKSRVYRAFPSGAILAGSWLASNQFQPHRGYFWGYFHRCERIRSYKHLI